MLEACAAAPGAPIACSSLTNHDTMLAQAFQGRHGKAFLFHKV